MTDTDRIVQVSFNFVWQTGSSYPTNSWNSFGNQINIDSLQAGDALDNPLPGNAGHMVLFEGWVNQSAGTFLAYEENFLQIRSHIS